MNYGEFLLENLNKINEAAIEIRSKHYEQETKLNQLIERTENLIQELEELTLSNRKPEALKPKDNTETKVSLEECRTLINRRVRIINPSSGEPNSGTIKSVGTFFATIVKPNGDKVKRPAKNLRLIHDE